MATIRTDSRIQIADFVTFTLEGYDLHVVPPIPSWIVTTGRETRFLTQLRAGYTIRDILLVEPESELDENIVIIKTLLGKLFSNRFRSHSPERRLWTQRKLGMYITDSCNYRCKHCYLNGKNKGHMLAKENIFEVLEKCSDFGVSEVVFLGAEPTLHPAFLDILRTAKKLGLRTVVLTNGSTVTNRLYAQALSESADLIQISIDGATREVADFIRSERSYSRAINAVHLLSSAGAHIEVASIVFQENESDFRENIGELLKYIGDNRVKIVPEMGFELRKKKNLSICSKGAVDKIKESIESHGFTTDYSDALGYKKLNCGYGEDILIQANGDMSCCIELSATTIANIYRDDFSECVRRLDYERDIMHVDHLPFCKDCELRYICGGACRVAERERFTGKGKPIKKCNLKDDILRKMVQQSLRNGQIEIKDDATLERGLTATSGHQ